jgi:hypothetical protein
LPEDSEICGNLRYCLLDIRLLLGSIGSSNTRTCGLHAEVERHNRDECCDDRCPGLNTHPPNALDTPGTPLSAQSNLFPLVMRDLDPSQYGEADRREVDPPIEVESAT